MELVIGGRTFLLVPIYFYNGIFSDQPAIEVNGINGFYGYVLRIKS